MSGCRLVSENALPDRNYQVSSSKRIGMSRPLLRSVGVKIGVKGRSQIGDIQSSSRCRKQCEARQGTQVFHRSVWKVDSANFVPIAFQGIRQMLNQA